MRNRSLLIFTLLAFFLTFAERASAADAAKIKQGEKLFAERQCTACHAINGKGGPVGPDLTKVGSRRDEAWLKKFLPDPKSVAPETMMPPFRGTKEELDALVAYLLSLK